MLAADEYYRVVSEREPDKIAWYQVLNMPRVDLRLLYGHSLGCARRIKTRSCRIFPGNFPEQRYDVQRSRQTSLVGSCLENEKEAWHL